MRAVANRYDANAVVLAEWKKGWQPVFYELDRRRMVWSPIDPARFILVSPVTWG